MADQISGVVNVELLHDSGPMGVSGLRADAEDGRRFLGCLALRDELKDLPFPGSERIGRRFGLGEERINHGPRDSRAQVRPSSTDVPNRLHQVPGGPGFQNITGHMGLERLQNVSIFRVHGQEYHFGPSTTLVDFAGRIEPVEQRHRQVEDNDVRLKLLCQPQSLPAVRGLPDHLEPFALHQGLQALPDDHMIIGQHNPKRHGLPPG